MSAWLNGIGNFLRNVSTFGGISLELRFWILLAGQTLAAISQPFVMFAPTKLAAMWFPDSQRATANMLASMGRLYLCLSLLRLFFIHHYVFQNYVWCLLFYRKKSRPYWFVKNLYIHVHVCIVKSKNKIILRIKSYWSHWM